VNQLLAIDVLMSFLSASTCPDSMWRTWANTGYIITSSPTAFGRETSAIFTESRAGPITGTSRTSRQPDTSAEMMHTDRNRSSVDSFAGTGSAASTLVGVVIELLRRSGDAGSSEASCIDGCRYESNHFVSTTVNVWA